MSDSRHLYPDGSVWIRTEPITFLHDSATARHSHRWHQLTYALRGHLEVDTDDVQALVPPKCAVWVPAGVRHRERMYAPVAVRTLYVAPGVRDAAHTVTVQVSPLLRELIVRACSYGSLDHEVSREARLTDVLLDELDDAPRASLHLPLPRDERARRLVDLIRADPANRSSVAELASRAGASVRTLERCFRREAGVGIGEWRRRLRLMVSLRLLESGAPVSVVAGDVGYATASAFTAAFTSYYGAPPTEHLRSHSH
ncbi:MAG: helix-turn-helix transcriptional regulator [Myxococcota bacterium]